MSTYNGRPGPNVSQYLRDLNTISPQDTTAATDDAFGIEEDLALFTNTQFFDFDSGQNTDFQAHPVKPDVDNASTQSPATNSGDATPATTNMGDISNLDFISGECICVFSLALSQASSRLFALCDEPSCGVSPRESSSDMHTVRSHNMQCHLSLPFHLLPPPNASPATPVATLHCRSFYRLLLRQLDGG